MQFMVSRRLVRLGGVDRGVDPPYRKKKNKNVRLRYCSCIYTLSSSLSCPSFIERHYSSLLNYPFVSGAQIWPILLILQFQMEPRET